MEAGALSLAVDWLCSCPHTTKLSCKHTRLSYHSTVISWIQFPPETRHSKGPVPVPDTLSCTPSCTASGKSWGGGWCPLLALARLCGSWCPLLALARLCGGWCPLDLSTGLALWRLVPSLSTGWLGSVEAGALSLAVAWLCGGWCPLLALA